MTVNLGLVERRPFAKLLYVGQETDAICIERAALDQAEIAYALVAEYYESLRVVARETPGVFRDEYFAPAAGVWLAWVGPNLAGCIALRQLRKDAAEIKRMYVREGYRGLGLGRKLLAA